MIVICIFNDSTDFFVKGIDKSNQRIKFIGDVLVSDTNTATFIAGTTCLIEFNNKKAVIAFYYRCYVLNEFVSLLSS